MLKILYAPLGIALVASCLTMPVAAQDGLDARTHAKVMKAKRAQGMQQNANPGMMQGLPPVGGQQAQMVDPCNPGVNIGNVYTDKNNRAVPRENTVVVTGDVIVVPGRNCR